VDAESRARLAALGYIGGTVSKERRGGPDPKTVVHLESELLLLQDFMTEGKFDRVVDMVPAILAQDPTNRLTLHSAAEASAVTGDLPAAERYARKAIEVYPEFVPVRVTLGRIQVAKKDYKAAEAVFDAALKEFPDEPILVYSTALARVADGRAKDAEPMVLKALEAPKPDPGFHVLHALCRAIAGDQAGAKKALEQAMAGGYANIATLRSERLLEPLRKLDGFEQIIAPKKAS
jgi:predicted Zn-dependent protease